MQNTEKGFTAEGLLATDSLEGSKTWNVDATQGSEGEMYALTPSFVLGQNSDRDSAFIQKLNRASLLQTRIYLSTPSAHGSSV